MSDNLSIILNSILYVLNKFENKTTDSHKLFKILYFAEQKHLTRFGKSITNDQYIAMRYGPVPSSGLDIINCSKDENEWDETLREASKGIRVNGYYVTSISDIDLEWLSKTDRDCLDESFNENKGLSFSQLTDKSHDLAWNDSIHEIDPLKIAQAGGANEGIINYISSKKELRFLDFNYVSQ